ncbi:unnamed protein product [Blepharisma stoltei]|uniref:3-hydroxyisobutyryl-CoA hydrolase n=1 Tax=Blepharisma stoltei TaxID=1481888 RepID=A0AAU9J1V5_9CILI|nr:unnamed protein product [Blepharisma stoltei]
MDSEAADSQVICVDKANTLFIKINRPSALNSWNLEMLQFAHRFLAKAQQERKNLVFYGEGRAFSVGGDILQLLTGQAGVEEVFMSLNASLYIISNLPTTTVTFMDGLTMGGGCGVSWACKIAVATPKTVWAMPESSIGFCPDAGSSYHLSRLSIPELGLYLKLTGERINGADCYFYGLAKYYILEDKEKILQEMREDEDLEKIIKKYHVEPRQKESTIMPIMRDLIYCFNNHIDVETIMYRLRQTNSSWSLKTLKKLEDLCPLSLRIAHEAFKRGKQLSYERCLKMEFNLAAQMLEYRNKNFKEAAEHKFINKNRGRVNWSPNSIEEVGESTIQPYFANQEGIKLLFPRL